MLKTFRRMFSSKTPLEFEISRDQTETRSGGGTSPHTDVISLEALEQVTLVATSQAAAQTRIESRLEELTPLARQAVQRLDAIGSGERDIAGLIETLKSELSDRERALGGSIEALASTGERQAQALEVLREQLHASQGTHDALVTRLQDFQSCLELISDQQKTTNDRSRELLDSMHAQNTRLASQQKRLTTATIVTCVVAGATLLTAVLIVLRAG